ncbi:MAG: endosialidase [Lachnospiraceae bacterium]
MSVINELIRTESDGTISFGDYTLGQKAKLDNFEYQGDVYKVKTFHEITKLERNGILVYESVPGTAVWNFNAAEDGVTFHVEAAEDVQITLELEAGNDYDVEINSEDAGVMKTNLGGKLSLSIEMEPDTCAKVAITKK